MSFDETGYGGLGTVQPDEERRGVASTATEIDNGLSTSNVTLLAGETALLACKIYNLGNKSVRHGQRWGALQMFYK